MFTENICVIDTPIEIIGVLYMLTEINTRNS